MIDPYDVAARVGCLLTERAVGTPGYVLPGPVDKRMGQQIFACPGVSVAITSIAVGGVRPNCAPDPLYLVDASIARSCAVEFIADGTTDRGAADQVARTMSADSDVLWSTLAGFNPFIAYQISGGLSIVSATFQTAGAFDLECAAMDEEA